MRKAITNLQLRLRNLSGFTRISVDDVSIDISSRLIGKRLARTILKGSYEAPERKLIRSVLRKGMSVVEVGAGIGLVGLLSARLTEGGPVVSYEANPDLEKIILHNYSLNSFRPKLNMRAVTQDGQPVHFFRNPNIVSSSLLDRGSAEQEKISVQSVRLQDVLTENKPNVLIMDVEGAEVSLLKDVNFGDLQHMIVELHPHIVGSESISQLITYLEGCNFSVHEQYKRVAHFERRA